MALDELSIVSTSTSSIVALLAFVLSALALRAARRRANPRLKWVAGAFFVFGLKNVFSAFNVATHDVPHDAIELALSVFDLVIILMLFVPLFVRRRRS